MLCPVGFVASRLRWLKQTRTRQVPSWDPAEASGSRGKREGAHHHLFPRDERPPFCAFTLLCPAGLRGPVGEWVWRVAWRAEWRAAISLFGMGESSQRCPCPGHWPPRILEGRAGFALRQLDLKGTLLSEPPSSSTWEGYPPGTRSHPFCLKLCC